MDLNLAEKLAFVKALDEVILADGVISDGELDYLGQLMEIFNFDIHFVNEARKVNADQAMEILKHMSFNKKRALFVMLDQMAKSDGSVDPKEQEIILSIILGAELIPEDFQKQEKRLDFSDVIFESTSHIRFSNNQLTNGQRSEGRRAIQIEANIEGKDCYNVTIYNLESVHPLWGNNIQIAPKQMKIIDSNAERTIFRGWGDDPRVMGHPDGSFENYGITVIHPQNEIQAIVLHLHDRDTHIEYLK